MGTEGEHHPPRLPHPPDPFPFSFSCRLLPQPFLPASPLICLLCLLLSVPAAVPGVAAAVATGGGPAHSPLPLLPSAVYHSGILRPTGRRHLGPASPPITALRPSNPSAAQPSPASPPRSPLAARLLSRTLPASLAAPSSRDLPVAGDEWGASPRPPRPRAFPRRRDLGGGSAATGEVA